MHFGKREIFYSFPRQNSVSFKVEQTLQYHENT